MIIIFSLLDITYFLFKNFTPSFFILQKKWVGSRFSMHEMVLIEARSCCILKSVSNFTKENVTPNNFRTG